MKQFLKEEVQFLEEQLQLADESHDRLFILLEAYVMFVAGVGLQDEFNAYLARKQQKVETQIDKS